MNQNIQLSHQLSVRIQNILFFLLCGLICASHTSTIRTKSHISINGSLTQEETKEWERAYRNYEVEGEILVNALKYFGTEITESVEYGDNDRTHFVLVLSEFKDVWRRIVSNPKSLVNTGESLEYLRIYIAQILFLANDRNCQSPDETFFNGQCLPVSTRIRSEHCDEYMGLYDDEKNEGICDCLELPREQAKSKLRPIYSNKTGGCYPQNTQGPCENGEWFVLKNRYPQCEPVPDGCETDGRHVYWNPDPSMPKECWEIMTQGPCEKGQLLHLEQDTEETQVCCSYGIAEHWASHSTSSSVPCPSGSLRDQHGKCSSGSSIG